MMSVSLKKNIGVDTTTENIPVVDILVNLSFQLSESLKWSDIICQAEVQLICHLSRTGSMSTGFQYPYSDPYSNTPYLWSGVEYFVQVLYISSDNQAP